MKASKVEMRPPSSDAFAEPKLPRRIRFRVLIGFGLITALGLASFWYLCRFSDKFAFLPEVRGAEWIVYPKPVVATLESAYPVEAIFRHSFLLQTPVTKSSLKLYSYKRAALFINDHAVPLPRAFGSRWKSPMVVDVSKFLRLGTNEMYVTVTNIMGPPALWLRLDTGNQIVATDQNWEVSLAGSTVEKACLARETMSREPDKSLVGSERTLDSIARIWPWLCLLAVGSLAITCIGKKAFRRADLQNFLSSRHATHCLLGSILLVRLLICFHNIPLLPRNIGFDAEAHEDYVKFISEKHALPLAKDGWEMFQPPLYYAVGAMMVGADGGYVKSEHTTSLLRALNGVVGLLHCWLVFLCLRRLFRDSFGAQTVGLTIGSFLPGNLNLSHYVTNEPLAALCATAAFFFLLRALANENFGDYIWLGIFLGLAMLSKFSSLLIVFAAAGALFIHLLGSRSKAGPNFWRGPLATGVLFLAVCGWHYLRVWVNSGEPIVGNWEANSPFAWRQDPGYHVAGYYLNFGRALVYPLFSSFHGFFDGIYSTLWGDGLAGGAARLTSRPPWNYDWMNSAYLVAVGLCVIAIVGVVIALILFAREQSAKWFFVLFALGSFAGAILFMSLRVPTYAQVKAFYGLPALAPFAAAFALGWRELVRRWPILRCPMTAILLVWVASVTISFWIRKDNAETSLVRGLFQTEGGQYSEAIENLSRALERDADALRTGGTALLLPSRVEGYFNLGLVLDRQGQAARAIEPYREALKLDPDFDGALNNLAWLLATSSQASIRNGTEAVALARRACDLTQERTTMYIGTLAAAYAEAGNFPEAVAAAEKAINCAHLRGEEELATRNTELLNLYRAGKPYRESAGL